MGHNILTFPESAKAEYFSVYQGFPHPSWRPEVYNIQKNLVNLAVNGRQALEALFSQASWDTVPRTQFEDGVYTIVYSTAHGEIDSKTMGALAQIAGLTAPSGKLNIEWLTGHSGGMLSPVREENGVKAGGEWTAMSQTEYGNIVVCSDLPRAIHHALLKYFHEEPGLYEQLAEFRERVTQDMVSNKGEIPGGTVDQLVKIALNHNIVPTPLARAAFYGEMELMATSLKGMKPEDIQALKEIVKQGFARIQHRGIREDILHSRVDTIFGHLEHRSEAGFTATDEQGMPMSENRIAFYYRAQPLLNFFFETEVVAQLEGRVLDFVAHSGFTDLVNTYFRYLENPSKIVLERLPKHLTKGKSFTIALGKKHKGFEFLNDPKKLDTIREKALNDIKWLRKRSLDHILSETTQQLADTPLVEYLSDEKGNPEAAISSFEALLESKEPVLLLGHGGQGKSMLALRIMEQSPRLPVYIRCRELNEDISIEGIETADALATQMHPKINEKEMHPTLKKEAELVYLIDDYHWLNPDYQEMLKQAVRTIVNGGDQVIVFSRLEATDVQPPLNTGFRTFRIDTTRVPSTIDEFVKGRLPEQKIQQFREMVESVDESIKGNYMGLAIIAMISSEERERVAGYITNEAIAQAIRKGVPLNSAQLYWAMIDYVTGKDIERQLFRYGKPAKEVRAEIKRWVDELEKLALLQLSKQYPKIKCLLHQ